MAPELLDERPYDYKADVWSAGCVLFELLNLKRAFEARSDAGFGEAGDEGSRRGLSVSRCYLLFRVATVICETLLSPKPRDRPDIVEILRAPIVITACDRVRRVFW